MMKKKKKKKKKMVHCSAVDKYVHTDAFFFFFQENEELRIPPSIRPSVCPSGHILLNQGVEFYKTGYITSPHGKDGESNIIFPYVRPFMFPSSIQLSLTLSPPKPLGGIQLNSSYRFFNHWA